MSECFFIGHFRDVTAKVEIRTRECFFGCATFEKYQHLLFVTEDVCGTRLQNLIEKLIENYADISTFNLPIFLLLNEVADSSRARRTTLISRNLGFDILAEKLKILVIDCNFREIVN